MIYVSNPSLSFAPLRLPVAHLHVPGRRLAGFKIISGKKAPQLERELNSISHAILDCATYTLNPRCYRWKLYQTWKKIEKCGEEKKKRRVGGDVSGLAAPIAV